jgi:hypothetical protein
MGYVDSLANGLFQTVANGRTVFFPFGQLGRGYEVPSGSDGDWLRQQYMAWVVTALIMALGSLIWAGYLAFLVCFFVWVVLYTTWALFAVRGLRTRSFSFGDLHDRGFQPLGDRLRLHAGHAPPDVSDP